MSLVTTSPALPATMSVFRQRTRLNGKTSIECASYYMLQLYRTNLEVRLRAIDESSLQTGGRRQIYASAIALLRDAGDEETSEIEWDDVYKAERMIALLLSGKELRYEIGARLQELSSEKPSEADRLRREYDALLRPAADSGATPADDGVLRLFLVRLMELLHSIAKKKTLIRPIRKQATRNILALVMAAFLLVIFPYIYLVFDYNAKAPEAIDRIRSVWSLFALYTALAAGLLGAFFSRLLSLNNQWSTTDLDEVFLHREFAYTLLRAGVGMCGALIVYFFLQSGIIEGSLFPDFNKLAIKFITPAPSATAAAGESLLGMVLTVPSTDLALLIVWCFLAGFSERLVPSILLNTERQLTSAAAGPKA